MVSGLIQQMRRRYSDLPQKHLDARDGDGSSTVYKTQFSPIYEQNYGVYVGGVLQSPGVSADYTIDLDTGDIVFASAPGNGDAIEMKYQSVTFRDQHWLEATQSSIRALGDEFFRSVIRSTSGLTLSAGVQVYPLPSSCIYPTEILASDNYTVSGNFVPLNVNHFYDRRSNKLILGLKPTRSNNAAISYLSRISLPTSVSSVLDVEENWIEPIELKNGAFYARARSLDLAQQGNVSVEEGHLSVQQMRQLANDNEALFQQWKRRNKPVRPSQTIPLYIHGGGSIKST